MRVGDGLKSRHGFFFFLGLFAMATTVLHCLKDMREGVVQGSYFLTVGTSWKLVPRFTVVARGKSR